MELEVSLNQNHHNLGKNLEFWMSNLPQQVRSLPIIYLAIPGSHDSTTCGIKHSSQVSPDAEPIIQKLKFMGPLLTHVMVRWSKTQNVSVTRQLTYGIRYLDFRISTRNKGDFYFVHGLYADEVASVLQEIKSFLESHPKEVVILDCQHFYAFQHSDHDCLMQLLTSVFSHKMCPYTAHMENMSLQHMTECKYQVIVVYRSDAARFGQPLLWPSSSFPTPWANTVSASKLIQFLIDRLKTRNESTAFISQCVLTPSSWFVVKHLLSTLEKQCVLPLEERKYDWLKSQRPGRGGINIVISDFVEYGEGEFARRVIELNRHLLGEERRVDAITPVDKSNF